MKDSTLDLARRKLREIEALLSPMKSKCPGCWARVAPDDLQTQHLLIAGELFDSKNRICKDCRDSVEHFTKPLRQ